MFTAFVFVMIACVAIITVFGGEAFGKGCGTLLGLLFVVLVFGTIGAVILIAVLPFVMSVVIPLSLFGGIVYIVHAAIKRP